jgi:hypothetical protein
MEDQMFQHFLKKRNRMSGKTMQRDRKISSKLVHIEQVIDLAKSCFFPIYVDDDSRTFLAMLSIQEHHSLEKFY